MAGSTLKVAVETRESTVLGRKSSLSVFLRLVRPLRKIASQGYAEIFEMSTLDLLDDDTFKFDLIFLSRPSSRETLSLAKKAATRGVALAVDLDDWMHGPPKYGSTFLKSADVAVLPKVLEIANVLTVPTSFFSQVMRASYLGPTIVLPYGFDFAIEEPCHRAAIPYRRSRSIIISSMFTLKLGSRLVDFASAVKRFLEVKTDWDVDFYSENYDRTLFDHPQIHLREPVSYADYLKILREGRYEFALVPLAGSEDENELLFNACKSPLKFVDYGANGIPAIYSRSPVFEAVVDNRITGLLVDNTSEDWYGGMMEMASNNSLRTQIAARSYEKVKSRYSLDESVSAMIKAIECAIR